MKVLIVVFVVVAVLGSTSAQSSNPVDQNAIASIMRSSDRATSTAESAQATLEDIVATLTTALNEASGNLEVVINVATTNLANLAPSLATNTSALIKTCLTTKNEAVTNITKQAGLEVISCFTDRLKAAQDILKDVISLGADALAIGPNALGAINNCPTSLIQRLPCVTSVAAKATAESMRIVLALSSNVAKATALVATLQVDLQRCVALKLVAYVLRGGQLAADIGLCVVTGL